MYGWILKCVKYTGEMPSVLNFLFDLISRVSSCRYVTGRYLPNRRRKASRYSNKPGTHQAIQSPNMEYPPASFLPVISSHFQMSVFRWAAPSNNFVPADN